MGYLVREIREEGKTTISTGGWGGGEAIVVLCLLSPNGELFDLNILKPKPN